MKVHFNLDALTTTVYHFVVAAVPVMVAQVLALHGHLGRDALVSIVTGAAVGAWHNVFPGGLADVKALIGKIIHFGK